MAWVGLDKAFPPNTRPSPAHIPRWPADSGPPARNDRPFAVPRRRAEAGKPLPQVPHLPVPDGCEAAPSHLGRVCPQHCQPCPSSPSPRFQSAGLSADFTPRTVPSSGGTNLAAVTESEEKSRLQITPWACNQENASTEQSHLPTSLPLGFAGKFLSWLFTAVVMT